MGRCSTPTVKGSTAETTKLGHVICQARGKGSSAQLIAHFQSDLNVSYGTAVNVVAMGEYHFCPELWDLG